MSDSSQIPNLKTLLGRGRGGGLRGRARGGPGASSESLETVRDNAVRGTDQDAAGSRVSCVELGYLDDPYARFFASQPSTRRLPLLNRGTYVRTSAIDHLIDLFLTTPTKTPKQIVSLGAGTDTRYFRLKDKYPKENLIYHELDFPTNTTSKLHSIHRSVKLQNILSTSSHPTSPTTHQSSYHSPTYNLYALDLRSLATSDPSTLPDLPNLNPTLPTLLLSEMCLIYLQPQTVSSIMTTFLTHYLHPRTPASLILYEPILPDSPFGRTMISNLSTRNIRLQTLTTYPDLGDQRARLRQYGFVDGCKAADTEFIWRVWVSEEEKERVGGLEMLDELEELELLLRHYCVCWGWRDGRDDDDDDDSKDKAGGEDEGGGDVFSRAWKQVRENNGG